MIDVGIVGVGTYLPEKTMKAAEIAGLTNGVWSEDAVINKLGIKQRYLPGPDDGTQEMGAKAALKCLENTGVDPKEIDVILCIGEEWKEYPLTTSACYIQDRIGATNAWGIDVQNRCCTCVSAMKIAADMLRADDEINTIMICGGYRNGDFVDFTDKNMSMMYNLSAGGGAIILKKNYGKNLLLGSKIMSDGQPCENGGRRNRRYSSSFHKRQHRRGIQVVETSRTAEDEGQTQRGVHAQLVSLHRRKLETGGNDEKGHRIS